MVEGERNWNWQWGWHSFAPTPFRCCGVDVRDQDQTMFDPWSLTHCLLGALQFVFIPFVWRHTVKLNGYFYLLNLGIHLLFEIVENSNCGIYILRMCFPLAVGDTVANTLGDLISFSTGYFIASGVWVGTNGGVVPLALTISILFLVGIIPFFLFTNPKERTKTASIKEAVAIDYSRVSINSVF